MPDRPRVLVVDDSVEMLDLLRVVLESDGWAPTCVQSGTAALALSRSERFELALLDLGLPDLPGDELFRALNASAPNLACVFVSANQNVDDALRLMRAGALDYLVKPISPPQLRIRLSALREQLWLKQEWSSLEEAYGGDAAATGLIVGADPAMVALLRRLIPIARTEAPVLIQGESGTGKERVANTLHRMSKRAAGPFVAVNMSAIPLQLWESEFFGHVKGAFTDAQRAHTGLIARAEGGTLFLDEIGECPLPAQAKLLRFLQEREYRPLGGTQDVRAKVRIVAATNRDLLQQVSAQSFREDLYYRLAVCQVRVPPLRERRLDIPVLIEHFVSRYVEEYGLSTKELAPGALAKLIRYDWPGNVRELENLVQQAIVTAPGPSLGPNDFVLPNEPQRSDERAPSTIPGDHFSLPLASARAQVVDDFERRYLEHVLARAEGNITQAAQLSEMPRKTFWRLLQKHGVAATRDGVVSKAGRPRAKPVGRS